VRRISSLEELRELPANWDSYGAVTISEEALATANALTFVPLADGGIQIELHAGGAELEIEISWNGEVQGIIWERKTDG
jgi:hypothetical protein